MLVKGDKIRLVKEIKNAPLKVGEICEVLGVAENGVSFRFGGYHLGVCSIKEYEEYFEKVEQIKSESLLTNVSKEEFKDIINKLVDKIWETEICKLQEDKLKETPFFEDEDWRGCPEECIEDCDNCPLVDEDDYYGFPIGDCDDDCEDCEICEYHNGICDDCPMSEKEYEMSDKKNECNHNWIVIALSNDGSVTLACTHCGEEREVELDFSEIK